MSRIKLTLAYVGTAYHGWQIQKNGLTIQEVLEKQLSRICDQPIRVHGSGRTDAGVHALGQVAHFDAPPTRTDFDWQQALNAMLPKDIAIVDVCPVSPDFHARFSALRKHYSYTLWTEPRFTLPQRAPLVWAVHDLNLEDMDQAGSCLAGIHDFAAFQNSGTETSSTIRTLEPITRTQGQYPGEWVFHFQANGFLKQMVRNLMGLLVQVGRGALHPQNVQAILASKDRSMAPGTAPPQGLCLEEVFY